MLMTVMVMDDGDDQEDDRQPVRESSVERNTYPVDEFNLKLSKSQDQRGKHLKFHFFYKYLHFFTFQSIRLDCASQTCISGRRKNHLHFWKLVFPVSVHHSHWSDVQLKSFHVALNYDDNDVDDVGCGDGGDDDNISDHNQST